MEQAIKVLNIISKPLTSNFAMDLIRLLYFSIVILALMLIYLFVLQKEKANDKQKEKMISDKLRNIIIAVGAILTAYFLHEVT